MRVRARVYDVTERLRGGQRIGADAVAIYVGLADYSGPFKDWQELTATEGRYSGTLYIKTVRDMGKADRVEIDAAAAGVSGEYVVESATTNGWQWALVLRRVAS